MLFTRNFRIYTFLLTLIALVAVQCKEAGKGAFTVTIHYKNLDKMVSVDSEGNPDSSQRNKPSSIILEEIPYGGEMSPVILDSVPLKNNTGDVVLKGTGKEESIFQVVVQNGPLFLLVNDGDNIKVDIDLSQADNNYTVTGSNASAELKKFLDQYRSQSLRINETFATMDSLKQAGADSLLRVATEKKNTEFKNLNVFLQGFIDNTNHPALGLLAIGWASRSLDTAAFEKTLLNLTRKFPEHNIIKKLKVTYEQQKAQASQQKSKPVSTSWIGKMAPDISMPTPQGKLVSISSFKGKYLLVDFWASWCGPCRQENPNVVRLYNSFKNKNFTILGVSLDKEKDAWQNAIKDDQLNWTQISDLKYWNSAAVDLYKIEGIPFNILVDPQGKVIGESLVGFDLEKKLNEVLQ